jgi:hypothetical protein
MIVGCFKTNQRNMHIPLSDVMNAGQSKKHWHPNRPKVEGIQEVTANTNSGWTDVVSSQHSAGVFPNWGKYSSMYLELSACCY